MAPVKFGDIQKPVKDLLSDDFTTGSFEFKAKQKTNLSGAVVTSTVELLGPDEVKTPAKLSWKIPTPVSFLKGVSVDKLELDKKGGCKLEVSGDSKLHSVEGLKIEAKTDLKSIGKASAGVHYSQKEAQFKIETALGAPADFKAEACVAIGPAIVGVSCGANTLTSPEVAVRMQQGPLFAAITAGAGFSQYGLHALFKHNDLQIAATYSTSKGAYTVGVANTLAKGTTLKAKLGNTQELHVAAKHDVCKGFTLIGGLKFDMKNSKHSYGLALSVE